jgi:nucleotide-binding universal stress UspA family protein
VTAHPCIVVGYDGSETARRALDYALERAGSEGSVIVAHAFEPPHDWLGYASYDRVVAEHRARGQALLDELEGEASIETDLLAGPPAEAIAQVAAARDADEIVVGSRGFGPVRAALGSISHELLRLADRPVVVIPPHHRTL